MRQAKFCVEATFVCDLKIEGICDSCELGRANAPASMHTARQREALEGSSGQVYHVRRQRSASPARQSARVQAMRAYYGCCSDGKAAFCRTAYSSAQMESLQTRRQVCSFVEIGEPEETKPVDAGSSADDSDTEAVPPTLITANLVTYRHSGLATLSSRSVPYPELPYQVSARPDVRGKGQPTFKDLDAMSPEQGRHRLIHVTSSTPSSVFKQDTGRFC